MIDVRGTTAHAMGEYIFTDSMTGDDVTVQYTFGYKRCADGKVRICLHHSSVPFQAPTSPKVSGAAAATALLTENDVHEAQKAWGNAIKAITKSHQQKQDFVATAAKAAGELYGYGHGNVLFKPTKATKNPFRPTAGDAMSYFVGGSRARMPVSRSTAGAGGLRWCSGTT
eukprot:TRINITY_DN496_c0_g1_i14.p1 TRINITY_DN496_c0_g1~~TRINITY_DN496_c0_g1_i14.p1  ORF type:complete len:170 (+),score=32.36 TRINITY_DN496_c0_g1_i14:425-934(+)